MQAKFAEITRISAIKLRTFASDGKAAKFRCFYCSDVGEISQGRWLIETKFRGMRQKFASALTKFRGEFSSNFPENKGRKTPNFVTLHFFRAVLYVRSIIAKKLRQVSLHRLTNICDGWQHFWCYDREIKGLLQPTYQRKNKQPNII